MVIAVDFDGTIVEHDYPKIGKPIPFAIDVLKKLHEERHTLILWTMREGDLLQEAIDYCKSKGLEFYAHNQNFQGEELKEGDSRKLSADIFIDDRNIGGLIDWGIIYKIIKSGENSLTGFEDSIAEYSPRRKKNWMIRLGEAWDKAQKNGY
ncbi:MAG: hypothetical protein LBH12_05840 [Dysgonamonadaceae bacterium]|jgi:hydroxymethylpyrimidine pyrophosphatase-like HAD family hydrolase|nr:hypothetical protein [Dysgonamonadaceae bacterium]